MNQGVKLVPFKVKNVKETADEVPWGVRLVGAPHFWQREYKGQGVVVAVLDTGCDMNHPDLKGRIIGGKNFTNENGGDPANFNDTNGHGTHVAGIIAADENGSGLVGVAPKAQLLIGKILDKNGAGSYQHILDALFYVIRWRGPNGEKVRIVNLSLGGAEDIKELKMAILNATMLGISVVVAAGNEGDNDERTYEMAYPAAYNEVIEVGAVGKEKELAYFTNNNTEVDCVAPGIGILSTYKNGEYAVLDGTSMAAPHVSGVLALLASNADKEFRRTLTEAELYAQLIKRTEELPYLKSSVGNGLVKLDLNQNIKTLIHYIQSNFCG
ncbi:MAG: S8 family peptidase [Bacillus sp. (in: firmicutes)]